MERPNILWVCTDQQRYDTIALRGNPHIRTPNLDRLVDIRPGVHARLLPESDLQPESGQFSDGYVSQLSPRMYERERTLGGCRPSGDEAAGRQRL